jgi:RNA polymerase sigma factor (sigma-70 family)
VARNPAPASRLRADPRAARRSRDAPRHCRDPAPLKKNPGVAVLRGVFRGSDELLEEIELIYRHRYPAFLRVAVAITGDERHGEDAVQDAFVGVVRSRRGLRRRAALEAFIWRAVVNAARDRRSLRGEQEPVHLLAPEVETGDERVRAAIAALPERQRLVLFLRYFADLDYRAISRVMGVRLGTVAASLNAARAAVKERLEDRETACP